MMSISGAEAKDIYVAIGPCIGICCYEVSIDVALNVFGKFDYLFLYPISFLFVFW